MLGSCCIFFLPDKEKPDNAEEGLEDGDEEPEYVETKVVELEDEEPEDVDMNVVEHEDEPKDVDTKVMELEDEEDVYTKVMEHEDEEQEDVDTKVMELEDEEPENVDMKVMELEDEEHEDVDTKVEEPENADTNMMEVEEEEPEDVDTKVVELEDEEPKNVYRKVVEFEDEEPEDVDSKMVEVEDEEPDDSDMKMVELEDEEPEDVDTKVVEVEDEEPENSYMKMVELEDDEPEDVDTKVVELEDEEPEDVYTKVRELENDEPDDVDTKVRELEDNEPENVDTKVVELEDEETEDVDRELVEVEDDEEEIEYTDIELAYILGENEDDMEELEDAAKCPTKIGIREDTIERDISYPGIYIRKHMKKRTSSSGQAYKKKSDRVYNNYHCCIACEKMVQHIPVHLKTHKCHPALKDELNKENPDYKKLRIRGDDKNNRKVLEKKKGEIIVSRRGSGKLDVQKYGPCPLCREWMLLEGLKKHYRKCGKKKVIHTKDLVLQSRILAGHIGGKPSKLMQNEVFKSLKRDTIGEIVLKDKLIIALGESWLRRNVDNVAKRRYYATSHMRLCGKLLQAMRHDEDDKMKDMQEMIDPKNFDKFVDGALKVSLPLMDDIEELQSPSNAIKLKYDIRRLVNAKYAFLLKTGVPDNQEIKKCKRFLTLVAIEWAERVTKQARTVLARRKLQQKRELPTPSDIETLTRFLMNKVAKTALVVDNFKEVVKVCQVRLLVYNKRRSGEVEVIR